MHFSGGSWGCLGQSLGWMSMDLAHRFIWKSKSRCWLLFDEDTTIQRGNHKAIKFRV